MSCILAFSNQIQSLYAQYLNSKQMRAALNQSIKEFTVFFLLPSGASSHHSQTSLRPPLPPPHNHHQSSANSLNRSAQASRRNPQSHAPAAAPADGPSTPESVQLQDSWALNSSVPLETRLVFKKPVSIACLCFLCGAIQHIKITDSFVVCQNY